MEVSLAAGALIPPPPVMDRQPPVGPHGLRDRLQVGRDIRLLKPAGSVEVKPLPNPRGPASKLRRQGCQHFQLRGRENGAQPELGRLSRVTRKEQGFRLFGREAGEPRSIALHQLEAAVCTSIRVDGYPRAAQLVDVAVDSSNRDLELVCHLLGRHPATRLEQQKDRNESAGSHAASVPDSSSLYLTGSVR